MWWHKKGWSLLPLKWRGLCSFAVSFCLSLYIVVYVTTHYFGCVSNIATLLILHSKRFEFGIIYHTSAINISLPHSWRNWQLNPPQKTMVIKLFLLSLYIIYNIQMYIERLLCRKTFDFASRFIR